MKRIFLSLATIAAVAGLLFAAFYYRDNKLITGLTMLAAVSVIGIAVFNFNLLGNIVCLLMAGPSAWGTYWAGGKTISSIDFDKPFLLSFYWSTVGYSLLTLLLLAFAILMLFGAALLEDG